MKLNSTLLSGAGNTFHIYFGVLENILDKKNRALFVRQSCLQDPADGVVFLNLNSENKQSYEWDFYNNDGSSAEMCGNATRCVGYYSQHILKNSATHIELQTERGLVKIQILENDMYKVFMLPTAILAHKSLFFCNTGVPHVVIELSASEKFENWKERCRAIRNSSDFSPQGTNVTLVKRNKSDFFIEAVSFERGVENFTLACGTGAIAAALFMNQNYKYIKTSVEMPGGTLNIDMSDHQKPTMEGPAKYLKDCVYELST